MADGANSFTQMMEKDRFLEFALSKFLECGCKRFTIDELAHELGISKKTIYDNFNGKEQIIEESLAAFLSKLRSDTYACVEKEKLNPILAIISIYRIGLNSFKTFSPSFFFGLKKYYPSVYDSIIEYRGNVVYPLLKRLLYSAKEKGDIREDINIELTCELYVNRLETILFTSKSLYEEYTVSELVEHLIINNLRGLSSKKYLLEHDFVL